MSPRAHNSTLLLPVRHASTLHSYDPVFLARLHNTDGRQCGRLQGASPYSTVGGLFSMSVLATSRHLSCLVGTLLTFDMFQIDLA